MEQFSPHSPLSPPHGLLCDLCGKTPTERVQRPLRTASDRERVTWFVYGWARGDEQKARAVLDAMLAEAAHGSVRGVAGRHGIARETLRRWVLEVVEGMKRAAVVLGCGERR